MKQVNSSHYDFSKYIKKPRMLSFWHQVDEVLRFMPKRVLEIGPGPGVVTDILRKQGIEVTTVDYAEDVYPDIIASVLDLPFKDDEYDVILCCQVLEHIKFVDFDKALAEIARVSRLGAVISLPNAKRCWPFSFYIPKIGIKTLFMKPDLYPRKHVFDGQHYWEIGKRGYSESLILSHIKLFFKKVVDYRISSNTYHHFYIARK